MAALEAQLVEYYLSPGSDESWSTHFSTQNHSEGLGYFSFWALVDNEMLQVVRFRSNGCASSSKIGAVACKLMEGRQMTAIKQLTGDDLRLLVGPLPDFKVHYLELAAGTARGLFSEEVEK